MLARINIEDSIYKDPRFLRLYAALGCDMDKAVGALVRAWSLAQYWYLKTPDKMVPLSEWESKEINPQVVAVGLAIIEGDRVKIRGADASFAWLLQKSAAGKRGAEIIEESRQRTLTYEVVRTPLLLSPSLSLKKETNTGFLSSKGEEAEREESAIPSEKVTESDIQSGLEAWSTTLKHYGCERSPTSDDKRVLWWLIKKYGCDTACLAIVGMRYEAGTNTYRPQDHLALHRLQNPAKFEKFLNLGSKVRSGAPARQASADIDLKEKNGLKEMMLKNFGHTMSGGT